MGATRAEPDVPDAVKPLLVQDVALVELHERTEDCPALIDVGLADNEAVGAGGAVTLTVTDAVADAPLPGQVTE